MLPIEPPPLLLKTVSLEPPVGVRVSTTTDHLKRLKRAEKCGAAESKGHRKGCLEHDRAS